MQAKESKVLHSKGSQAPSLPNFSFFSHLLYLCLQLGLYNAQSQPGKSNACRTPRLRVFWPVCLHCAPLLLLLTSGRPGVFAISFGLPIVCYLTTFLCNDISGCPAPSTLHPKSLSLKQLKKETGWPGFTGLLSVKASLWMLSYYLLSLTLQRILPGQQVEGTELRSGGKLKYKFNGECQCDLKG